MNDAIGTTTDAVQEALERDNYPERKIAYGECEGEEVAVFAWLNKHGTPELTVCGGGHFERYDDPNMRDEYVRGESLAFHYERVDQMDRDFRQLAEDYRMETYVEESDD